MTIEARPDGLAERAVFLAWGPPSHTNRTRVFAAALGVDVHHVYSTRRRGALAAPIKYPYQAGATVIYLCRRRPEAVLVQSPPSFAAVFVAIYAALTGGCYVIDAHTDAFVKPYWTRPGWLYRWVARRALTTIVTNEHLAETVRRGRADACVIRDIPTRFENSRYHVGPEFNVAVVSTFADDEPLDEVMKAARSLPEVRFRVTGDTNRENASIPISLPDNVELTGFLPSPEYYGLLRASDAVMSLTTRDHTMQRGACEALWVGTPIVTSDWPLLRDYFHKGSVHVDNTAAGICAGVNRVRNEIARYRRETWELQSEVLAEWETARAALTETLSARSSTKPDNEGAPERASDDLAGRR